MRCPLRNIWLALTIGLLALPIRATEHERFVHYSLEQGLSQSTVLCILQDKRGFLWLGTEAGLNRYDGYNFKVYGSDSGSQTALTNLIIHSLYQQAEKLWIGTDRGLNLLDLVHDKVTLPRAPLDRISVTAICEAADPDQLWVGTRDHGLYLINSHMTVQAHYAEGHHIHALALEPESNTLLLGTHGQGLWRLGGENLQRETTGIPQDTVVTTIYEKNGLYVGTARHGLYQGTLEQGFAPVANWHVGSESPPIQAITRDKRGTLWVGTEGQGLLALDERGITSYTEDSANGPGPSENTIRAIYEDDEGNLWLGAKGLDRLTWTAFYNYRHGISSSIVRAIAEATESRQLWIGTDGGGLNRVDLATQQVTHYREGPGSISSDQVLAVTIAKDGAVYVGTKGAGLDRLDPNGTTIQNWRIAPNDPSSGANTVRALTQADPADLWLGTDIGLYQFQYLSGEATHIYGQDRVRDLYRTANGQLLLATENGLVRYEPENARIEHYHHDPTREDSLGVDHVLTAFQDSSGRTWAGTYGAGLAQLVGPDRFIHFRERDGLPNNVVYAVLEDGHGELWLSTNRGLCRFTPSNSDQGPITRNYNVYDGLQSNEYNTGACLRASNGRLYFGGINGYDAFDPEDIEINESKPRIAITNFKVFEKPVQIGEANLRNRPILDQAPGTGGTINLTWQENAFSFEFAALSLRAPEKNSYAYQMEGFDKKWVQAGSRRHATYTNLDPGTYTFRVKASNDSGTWSEQELAAQLVIMPPPWKTGPAYFCYFVLGIAILAALRYFELGRIRLQNELELERIDAERLRESDRVKSHFFANISHELRTPLTLILGPLRRLSAPDFHDDPRKYYRLMAANGERILRLINQLLDLARLEARSLPFRATPGNLPADLARFAEVFSAHAEEKDITFRVTSPEQVQELYYDRDKLEKVVCNLLANAFHFTPKGGQVSLTLSEESNAALISVEDTGRGIPADRLAHIFDRFYQATSEGPFDRAGSGIGLALARELVRLHGGEIQVESQLGKGSTFTVRLPRGTAHLTPDQWSDAQAEAPDNETEASELINTGAPELAQEEAPHLLLIEDHRGVRAHLREIFTGRFRVSEAADVDRGFQLAIDRLPDLIISDVFLPGIDSVLPGTEGIELARRLKNDERSSHIPVVLLTARATRETRLAGLDTGADAFLTKPFDPEELVLQVTRLIEQRRLLRARFSHSEEQEVTEVATTSADERFLRRAIEVVEQHMGDPDFTVEEFGSELGMSRVQLYRKLQALTDTSPSAFVRSLRLKRAARLLREGAGNVSEITFSVGFSDPSYFARCFRKEMGSTPTQYAETHRAE